MKKSVAVLGLGRFGKSLAENLYRLGADVLVADSNEALVQDFSGKCTSAVCADLEMEEDVTALGLNNMDVVVVDSVAALIPRSELEGEIGDSVVGVLARLMSQAMRRLAGAISKNNCTVIFINQLRQKIGVMYGNPETTPGGLALKYYASVRIDVRRVETLKVNGEMIGNHTRAKVVKNKLAPPFKEAEFDIMYGEGISRVGEIVDLGVKLEIIEKGGAWFTVEDNRIQGRDGVKQFLVDNPEVCERIEAQIRENAWKLAGTQGKRAAIAMGRTSADTAAVDVSADDFDLG